MTSSTDDLTTRLAVSACHRPVPADRVVAWVAERKRQSPFEVAEVPFDDLEGWSFTPGSGALVHRSGRFFTIDGLHVRTDHGPVPEWWQPIINQQDIAILGIVAKEIDGVLHFLMQAKMEPGNPNGVQLSPTVQATSSNYLRAHKGARSRYLEYFTDPGRARVLVDILQSEQGSWFAGKRNRNIVVEVTGDVADHEDFAWLTLGQLFDLLQCPNLVNMDSRTVLSCLPLPSVGTGQGDQAFRESLARSVTADDASSLHPAVAVRSWLIERKAAYSLTTHRVPLSDLVGWERGERRIFHRDGRYFSIAGVRVQASSREVASWCQPLLSPVAPGLVAFLVRRIDGVLHVLAHADLRPGYRDVVELGPTVQCSPSNFEATVKEHRPEMLDVALSGAGDIRYDVPLSEEGGRFLDAVNRYLIMEVGDDVPLELGPDSRWLTVSQLKALVRGSYQINIEARSLLLCLHTLL